MARHLDDGRPNKGNDVRPLLPMVSLQCYTSGDRRSRAHVDGATFLSARVAKCIVGVFLVSVVRVEDY